MKTSIILASYNGARFIDQQLHSFVVQSIPPHELIIVDDHSSDDTCKIIENFISIAPFAVKIIKNERNIGSTKSFEKALRYSSGDVIFFSDQDDIWLEDKIELITTEFSNNSQTGLIFSDAFLVNERLEPYTMTLWQQLGLNKHVQHTLQSHNSVKELMQRTWVTGATMALRKEIKSSLFPIPKNWIHDSWISIIAAFLSKIRLIPKPLIRYRQHSTQQIGIICQMNYYDRFRSAVNENEYRRDIELNRISLLINKLESLQFSKQFEALNYINRKFYLLQERIRITKLNKLHRFRYIFRYLVKGYYHHYFHGMKSFITDMFAP